MASGALLLAGGVSVLTAVAFSYVAWEALRGSSSPGARLAGRAHAIWWGGAASYLAIHGTLTLAAAADRLSWEAYWISRIVTIPTLCAAAWGLTFYLTFLYTGRTRTAAPLAVLYTLVAATFAYAFFTSPPGLVVERWLVGSNDEHPLFLAVYALVGLPPIAASAALMLLIPRVRDPERRYRLALLGGSIFLYVGSGLIARIAASDLVIFLTLVVVGLGAAGAAVAAYHPPRRLRREGR